MNSKTLALFTLAILASSSGAHATELNCQHPYCNGPIDSPLPDAADRLKGDLVQVGVETFTSAHYKPGLNRHLVLFRYKDDVTAEQKAEIKQRFLALQRLCVRNGKRYIVSIETGAQDSGEGVDQSLEQGFIVTLSSQGDRNFYVGQPLITDPAFFDPAHQAFKDFVGPLLHTPVNPTGVVVFDFAIEARAGKK